MLIPELGIMQNRLSSCRYSFGISLGRFTFYSQLYCPCSHDFAVKIYWP